jgi:hypothetical protein
MPGTYPSTTRFQIKEETSFTELVENREAVLLDLDNLHYYTLNGTAIEIWRWMRGGEAVTLEQVISNLCGAFSVPEGESGRMEQEVSRFLGELEQNGLLLPCEERHSEDAVTRPGAGDRPYVSPQLRLASSLSRVTLSGSSTIATAAISSVGG